MSVGRSIRDMIQEMMFTASIDSPRFDDYKISGVEVPPVGLEDSIDDEIKKLANPGIKSNEFDAQVKDYGKDKKSTSEKNQIFKALGITDPRSALNLLSNPSSEILKTVTGLFKNFGKMIPMMGPLIVATLAIPEVAKKIATQLTARGSYFDLTFRKNLDTMVNRMRTIEQQQSIRSGFTPVIFTSRAGTPYERDSYNTYVQVNNADVKTDKDYSIRDTYGVQ